MRPCCSVWFLNAPAVWTVKETQQHQSKWAGFFARHYTNTSTEPFTLKPTPSYLPRTRWRAHTTQTHSIASALRARVSCQREKINMMCVEFPVQRLPMRGLRWRTEVVSSSYLGSQGQGRRPHTRFSQWHTSSVQLVQCGHSAGGPQNTPLCQDNSKTLAEAVWYV